MKLVMNFESPLRTLAIRVGVGLLGLALALLMLGVFNVVPFSAFDFAGHSGIRTIAALAILGCITSAIASWEI